MYMYVCMYIYFSVYIYIYVYRCLPMDIAEFTADFFAVECIGFFFYHIFVFKYIHISMYTHL